MSYVWNDEAVLQVVLVGHSMGGIANLMLMEMFPHKIDVAVFVAAVVIPSGVSLFDDTTLLNLVSTSWSHLNNYCSVHS